MTSGSTHRHGNTSHNKQVIINKVLQELNILMLGRTFDSCQDYATTFSYKSKALKDKRTKRGGDISIINNSIKERLSDLSK